MQWKRSPLPAPIGVGVVDGQLARYCISVQSPDVLASFHPLVAGWFRERLGEPTAPQRGGWPAIAAGQDTLIAAPTGSGKTLAAFLASLDALVCDGLRAPLPDRVHILYVSPLKALSNDVHRNLSVPLAEIAARAAAAGVALPHIEVGVRTGDTPMAERERMAKRPPHILVTTPESIYIMLTTERGRAALAHVRTVIVDEIHAIAGDKRGAHLALSLERLDRLVAHTTGRAPVRVGLSATQRPIERVAALLGGRRLLPTIIDGGHRRDLDLAIEITDDELGAVASLEQMGRVYDRIAELVGQHQTTLVFVNTRRLVERVAHALEQRLGESEVVAHHGSMARERRFQAEARLKDGSVKCAVATASLELGIDVGAVDLVVQIGSPRSLATLLQRVGRSGHSLGATPKGRLFAMTRDQLVECGALIRGVRRGNLDELTVRDAPVDILCQQMVAACAAEELGEDELFALVTGAAPYAALSRARFDELLAMLSEGMSTRRRVGQLLHRDRVGGRLKARRGARLLAITSGGAIPDNANYAVIEHPSGTRVGDVDEDFAIDSSAGDIFLLGNTAWKIHRVENGRVFVEDAHGQPPTIPFWFGEAPARTRELSDEVSDLRAEVDQRLSAGAAWGAIAAWLEAETSMSRGAAEQLVVYLAAGRAALGALPRKDLLIAERFFDEGGGMQLVIHAPPPTARAAALVLMDRAPLPGVNIPAEFVAKFDLKPKEITAALVGLKQRGDVFRMQRFVNQYRGEPLLGVMPGVALDELWQTIGIVERSLLAVSALVVLVGLAGLAATLLAGLNERRRELAILRALGAGPGEVFLMLTAEGLLVTTLGALLGLALLGAGSGLAAPWLLERFGVVLATRLPGSEELALIGAVILTGLLASLVPGWRAWRMSLADGLTPRL